MKQMFQDDKHIYMATRKGAGDHGTVSVLIYQYAHEDGQRVGDPTKIGAFKDWDAARAYRPEEIHGELVLSSFETKEPEVLDAKTGDVIIRGEPTQVFEDVLADELGEEDGQPDGESDDSQD